MNTINRQNRQKPVYKELQRKNFLFGALCPSGLKKTARGCVTSGCKDRREPKGNYFLEYIPRPVL